MRPISVLEVFILSVIFMFMGQSCFDRNEDAPEANALSENNSVPNTKAGPYSIAKVKLAEHSWEIEGSCQKKANDVTFYRAGEPLMTLGININELSVTGNMRSKKDNISIIIGNPELPAPTVKISDDSYMVSGIFLVLDGSKVEGSITVECKSG